MNPNPYAPPQAPVADVAEIPDAGADAPPFFPVSRLKLLVMFFSTLGLYQMYWPYKNWKMVRLRTDEKNIMPFWRAFFGVFFFYSLLDRVKKHDPESTAAQMAAGGLAAAWIIPNLLWKLPDPYWLICLASIFVLLPVQGFINELNRKVAPGHEPNSRFSAWNWVGVVLGIPLMIMTLWGAFLPPQ
jgi:hypothetical protein